jgi:four helix bundle protein
MQATEMKARTKQFAVRALRLVNALPRSRSADVIGGQLLRAATSVAANYRAACRARSRREFLAKLGIVEEEADESQFWLEVLMEGGLMRARRVESLRAEAGELVAMIVASIRTARRQLRANPQSAIRNPQTAVQNPQSAIRNPQSAVQNPQCS